MVGALNQIRQKRGTPKMLFCDNGSEFTSQIMDLWAYHSQVQIDFSRPGKPTDNAHVESFNGTLRAECLDVHWFATLTEAKQVIEAWRQEYNESRPHRSLGERTPSEFACQIALKGDLPAHKLPETHPESVTEKGDRSLHGRSHISSGLIYGGHIWTHPDCKSLRMPARWKRDACIYPASYIEEPLAPRALMDSARFFS